MDEIAEMPLSTQPKFLRAIQEGEGSRLGSNKTTTYDVRLIRATNKDLAAEVQKGAFRQAQALQITRQGLLKKIKRFGLQERT